MDIGSLYGVLKLFWILPKLLALGKIFFGIILAEYALLRDLCRGTFSRGYGEFSTLTPLKFTGSRSLALISGIMLQLLSLLN
jgi:hypothetical protein